MITTMTQKGQVTVPSVIRTKYGMKAGTKVRFRLDNGTVIITPLPEFSSFRGSLKGGYDKQKVRTAIGVYLGAKQERINKQK